MATETVTHRLLYPRREAAYLLGVSPSQITRMERAGLLEPRRIGGRVLFPFETLRKFAENDQPTIRSAEEQ